VEHGAVKQDFGFSDKSIRAGFIRKVFILVTIMLAVVAGMVAFALFHQPTGDFLRRTPELYYAGYVVFLIVYIALMCCESVRRSFPSNLIACGILTLAIGYMTMMITAMYNMSAVLMALGITTGCCAGIIIFASVTKHDLTSCLGIMCILGMVLFFVGMVAIIIMVTTGARWLYLVYAGLAALLFMVYLAIDVQMIMGGRKYEISPEDYIFAAIQVFLDIIYIFWMLLSLIGGSSR
jgi:FtsH-binding integral membrane protein